MTDPLETRHSKSVCSTLVNGLLSLHRCSEEFSRTNLCKCGNRYQPRSVEQIHQSPLMLFISSSAARTAIPQGSLGEKNRFLTFFAIHDVPRVATVSLPRTIASLVSKANRGLARVPPIFVYGVMKSAMLCSAARSGRLPVAAIAGISVS